MKIAGVYKITSLDTKKVYIGSSVNVNLRMSCHLKDLNKGAHHSKHLQRAWDKYGHTRFTFEVIDICIPAQLIAREQHWMDHFKAADHEHGYNMVPVAGSNIGRVVSAETRAKLSKAKKGTVIPLSERHKHGSKGVDHGGSKLSPEQVMEIRKIAATGMVKRRLAEQFGLSATQVGDIVNGKSWSHLPVLTSVSGARKGVGNHHSKITPEIALEVRSMALSGKTTTSIAEKFKVGFSTISDIIKGKTWKT